MDESLENELLDSIAARRLAILCGAGLSMASPSSIPSAAAVAEDCAARYRRELGIALPASAAATIEDLARHFHSATQFESLFIARLVPWSRFEGVPNAGHYAVVDFLASSLIPAAITTNVDVLFEQASRGLGESDFHALVTSLDVARASDHAPLIKVHGCMARDRATTLWCRDQLSRPEIQSRQAALMTQLTSLLTGKDLAIIGFWTDWAYLNELFQSTISSLGPRRLYAIDIATPAELRSKAPGLWAWAHSGAIEFRHVPMSGAEFLDALRRVWTHRFITRLMVAAEPSYAAIFRTDGAVPQRYLESAPADSLYALRRDLTGTPVTAPMRERDPADCDHLAAAIHQRLLEQGFTRMGHYYTRSGGKTLRVVSGRGRLISEIRKAYASEPPALREVDDFVCVSAVPDPMSSNIVRGNASGSIVRPGSRALWTTHEQLVQDLQE